jgi:predicted AAA+ superfamily ATPase
VLSDLLAVIAEGGRFCWLLLDEVTYVDGWDRIVKFLADAGTLDACFLIATGSDHLLIEDSLKRLPGRRGLAEMVDFRLRPLSFLEFCRLRRKVDGSSLDGCAAAGLAERSRQAKSCRLWKPSCATTTSLAGSCPRSTILLVQVR